MQSSLFEVKCPNFHEASHLCITRSCSHPSPKCNELQCDYSQVHRRCPLEISVEKILNLFTVTGSVWTQTLDQSIIGAIDKMIKNLEILRFDYLNNGRDSANRLKGNSKAVFEMLINGPTKQLSPECVHQCIQSLENSKGYEEVDDLKAAVETVVHKHSLGLEEIGGYWRRQEVQKKGFSFSQSLYNWSQFCLLNQGKNIKRIHQTNNFPFVVISPCLQKARDNAVRIKIVKKRFLIPVGLARKSKLIESKFQYPPEGEGMYLIRSDGHVCNPFDSTQNGVSTYFGFKEGDVIEMKYLGESNQLRVSNLFSMSSFTLSNIPNPGDLCYLLGLYYKDDQIQILE